MVQGIFIFTPHVCMARRTADVGPFSTALHPVRSGPLAWSSVKTPFFLYEFHTSGVFLRAPSLTSGLYCILLQLLHRDYAGAFARLEGVATDMAFNPEEREIFKAICANTNRHRSDISAAACGTKWDWRLRFAGFQRYPELNTEFFLNLEKRTNRPKKPDDPMPTWWDRSGQYFVYYDFGGNTQAWGRKPGWAIAKKERWDLALRTGALKYNTKLAQNICHTSSEDDPRDPGDVAEKRLDQDLAEAARERGWGELSKDWIETGRKLPASVELSVSGDPCLHPDAHAFWAKLKLVLSSSPEELGFDAWSEVAMYVKHLSRVSAACRLTLQEELRLHEMLGKQTKEILDSLVQRCSRAAVPSVNLRASELTHLAVLMLSRFQTLHKHIKGEHGSLPLRDVMMPGADSEEPSPLDPLWLLSPAKRPSERDKWGHH